jgi:hypothetical protein
MEKCKYFTWIQFSIPNKRKNINKLDRLKCKECGKYHIMVFEESERHFMSAAI